MDIENGVYEETLYTVPITKYCNPILLKEKKQIHKKEMKSQRAKKGKFEVYKDKAGEYRFRLKASNGEIIAASEGYKNKKSCFNGIYSVIKYAPKAKNIFLKN